MPEKPVEKKEPIASDPERLAYAYLQKMDEAGKKWQSERLPMVTRRAQAVAFVQGGWRDRSLAPGFYRVAVKRPGEEKPEMIGEPWEVEPPDGIDGAGVPPNGVRATPIGNDLERLGQMAQLLKAFGGNGAAVTGTEILSAYQRGYDAGYKVGYEIGELRGRSEVGPSEGARFDLSGIADILTALKRETKK